MLEQLAEIENRKTDPTHEEWVGILHDVAMNEDLKMVDRIRALAQMDRVTGEPGDLTEAAVLEYTLISATS